MVKRNNKKAKRRENRLVIGVCLAPSVTIIGVFTYLAFFFCLFLSFQKWDMLTPIKFVGMKNYKDAFTSEDFWNSIKVTFEYVLITVPVSVLLGLIIGLLLNWITIGASLFRVMIFIPVITSMVIAAIIWSWLFDPSVGFINQFLFKFGCPPSHWTQWLFDSKGGALLSVMVVGIWKRMGYNGVLFLGGLKNIDPVYYEVAELEGASTLQKFNKITFPLVSPTTFIVTMMQLFASFKVLESILIMTKGGPANSTNVLAVSLYTNAFQYFKMGYASALSIVLFMIILFFTLVQFALEKKLVFYQ